jgi:hypothetical protein
LSFVAESLMVEAIGMRGGGSAAVRGGRAAAGVVGGLSRSEAVNRAACTAVGRPNVVSMSCQSVEVVGGIICQLLSEVGRQTTKEESQE